jgi:radical SAM superfamily enzyme YgiQ (UPF0313 family)
MKVLLIAPYLHLQESDERNKQKREDFLPSTALIYLAAALRERGHEPILLDFNSAKTHRQADPLEYCNNKIVETISDESPGLVGLNCLFSGLFETVLYISQAIKTKFPEVPIAIGGIHPTTYPREILSNIKEIDFIVNGEGEDQIVALANLIEDNDESKLPEIHSFAYRNGNGKVVLNDRSGFIEDLDVLPMPAWDLIDFEDYEMDLSDYYNPKNFEMKNHIPLFTSRACPYTCTFCDMYTVMGRTLRLRSPKKVVDELEYLNRERGLSFFSFMDDNLTVNKKHILGICGEIINRKLNIQFDTPNGVHVNSLTEEIVAVMVKAGLIATSLAIEHGNDFIRNRVIKKNLPRKKIYEVAALFKKYKVLTAGLFIVGFPEETPETMEDQYRMMSELQLDRMCSLVLIPFPGTEIFKQAVRDDLFVKKVDLDNMWKTPMSHAQEDFVLKPYNMTIEELHEYRAKLESIRYKYSRKNLLPQEYVNELQT